MGKRKNYLGFTERIMTVMFSKSFTGSSTPTALSKVNGDHKLEDLLHKIVSAVIFLS
jgi:hypothetical protein